MKALPVRARVFVAGVILLGVAAAAVHLPEVARWSRGQVLAWGGLALAIMVAEQFWIPFRHRTEVEYFSLTDAPFTAGLLLAAPGPLVLAVAAGSLVGQAIRRGPLLKLGFNVGQFLVGITVAVAVSRAIRPEIDASPVSWLAVAAGMAAYFAVNETTVAMVIALVEGRSFRSILVPTLGLSVLHWAGNLAIGILAAVVIEAAPAALPLLIVPLVLSYLAYRARVEGQRERDQMRHMYEASRTLLTPIAAGNDFGTFLERVRLMLDAQAAELVVTANGQAVIHGIEGPPVVVSSEGEGASADGRDITPEPDAFVPVRPGLTAHVAVARGPEGVRCALAVYRNRELTASDRAAFDALASQLAVKLENRRLFAQTVEQRGELAEIIAHSSDGIFVVSPNRTILSWNPAMERITGFGAQEAIGRRCEEILWRSTADGRGPGEPFALGSGVSADTGEADEVDAQIVTKAGAPRWIRYTYTPVADREGGLKADVVVARDVTAEREADQLKADFVATVSHELRTPLTPLKGFLHTLMENTVEDSPAARLEYYRIMLNQADRLERLITDLLEVSSIESGAPVVTPQLIELTTLIGDQVDEFSRQQGGRPIRYATPGIPVIVRADPFRVQQVVANLVGNALKYSPPETAIDVSVRMDGEEAVVSVRDQGEGIPPTEHERVFQRFHRVDNGLTRRTGGTGLGLYIAKRLVEAMAGRLWLVSAPDRGSTFSFSLPLHGVLSSPAPDRGADPGSRQVSAIGGA